MKDNVKKVSLSVITPIWKEKLTNNEYYNLKVSFGYIEEWDHYFICPMNLDISFYQNNFPKSKFVKFSDQYFKSIKGYNVLLQSTFFYNYFKNSKFILILQTDAIIVRKIDKLINYNFDYLGAPWGKGISLPLFVFRSKLLTTFMKKIGFKLKCYVGNGGLSLRRTDTFINVCESLKPIKWLNEDLRFSVLGGKKILKIPNKTEAERWFFEKTEKKIEQLPNVYGFHSLEKYYPELYKKLINERYEKLE